jgi:hypothetical protein
VAKKMVSTTPTKAESEPTRGPTGDIALVCGRDAEGVHILRRRSEEAPIETGLLRPMREGKPIDGEVVSLTPRADLPMLFDVKSEFGAPAAAPGEARKPQDRLSQDRSLHERLAKEDRLARSRLSGDGPAQVSNDAYRKGWDAVWGRRRDRSVN